MLIGRWTPETLIAKTRMSAVIKKGKKGLALILARIRTWDLTLDGEAS
jgi:hypothetical protein